MPNSITLITNTSPTQLDNESSAFNQLKVATDNPVIQIAFPYGLNNNLINTSTSNGGTVTSEDNFAICTASNLANSSAVVTSKRFIKYRTAQGAKIVFTTIYSAPSALAKQIMGVGTTDNGFFFGYVGTNFCIIKRNNGIEETILQNDWNVSTATWLDKTKGNVYSIQYQWLGFGQVVFFIENPVTGKLEPVHRIKYANANTSTSIRNPSIPIRMEATTSAIGNSVSLRSPSMAAFIEGTVRQLGPINAIDNTKTVTSATTLLNIITIQNKSIYKSQTSFIPVILYLLSVTSDGNKNAVMQVIKNATVSGSPSFVDINSDSCIQYDIAGTTEINASLSFQEDQ